MKLYILFGQRKESYFGEYAPEPLECWSEFEVEENEDGLREACAKHEKNVNKDFVAFKVIHVEVDQEKIREALVGTVVLKGQLSDA